MSTATVEERLQLVVDRLEDPIPRRGMNGYLAKCPAHNDHSPSFTVFINEEGYLILHCYAKCSREKILESLDLTESDVRGSKTQKGRKESASSRPQTIHFHRYDKRRLRRKQVDFPDWSLQAIEYQQQLEPDHIGTQYLQSRGISYDIAKQYGLGYCPERGWCHRNKKGNPAMRWKFGRITVPHTIPSGQIVNIYSRAIGEASKIKDTRVLQYFKQVKHAHLPGAKGIFNAQALQADTVFICEGIFDALSLISAGYTNSCAIFGTKGIPWDWIQAKTLILCLDNDDSGSEALQEIAMNAVLRGKQVFYLEDAVYHGCKDLNETWCKHNTLDLGNLDVVPTTINTTTSVVVAEAAPTLEQDTSTQTTKACGYYAIGNNQPEALQEIKEKIIQAGVVAFDYESNSDPNNKMQDPQDTQVVGVSLAWELGHAVYLPIDHQGYEHNWNRAELFEQFLKPILLHPDVTIIAHNIKVEQQWSILNGLNLYPKALQKKAMDTMLMVKALALPETVRTNYTMKTLGTGRLGDVVLGLKPLTRVLLADADGYVHDLLHVDEIKSFKETVGIEEWQEPDPSGALYKSGKRKGTPRLVKKRRIRRFDELPLDQHTIDYACSDSDWTLGLYYKLLPRCRQTGVLDLLYDIDVPRMLILGEYDLSGWHIDIQKLQEYQQTAQQRIPQLEQQLMVELKKLVQQDNDEIIVPAGKYEMGTVQKEPVFLEIKKDRPFEWGSAQCLQWLFFHVLGLSTEGLARTAKQGLPSVSSKNIDKLLDQATDDMPFMRLLKEKANYDKIASTYVFGMGDHVRKDTNKIHTQLGIVATWRYHSKSPNLQNIPNIKKDPFGIRNLFRAPAYDPQASYDHLNKWTRPTKVIQEEKLSGETMWIGADYSQLELRVMAVMAKEQGMIDAFLAGYDLHSATARDVFKLPCKVEEVADKYASYRKQAKAVNFGLAFGISPYGLARDLKISEAAAKELVNDYYQTYPNIKRFMDGQIAFGRQNGYVETLLGHRRPILRPLDGFQMRKAMNTPVQGGGADVTTHAMVVFRNLQQDINQIDRYQLRPALEKLGLTDTAYVAKLVKALKALINIHDEIIFECPVEYVADGAKLVKAVMEAPIPGVTEIVPMIAEPAVGKVWAHNLDIHWDENGTPYVEPKQKKDELADVTIDEIQYALPLYKQAGIEVRVK